jgi:hypothetical protein
MVITGKPFRRFLIVIIVESKIIFRIMFIEPIRKQQLPFPETKKAFIFWVLLAYISVEITGIIFHPMWRDEIHTWSMAGASSSLRDLLQRKAIEGHPDLWYIMVYTVRSLGEYPFSMQLLHSGIAILTVFLILKYAPFTRVQLGLLVFGYFYLFEYAMISRNYAIGILLVTLLLTLYRQRPRFLFLNAFILFFLAQTNAYGLILCAVLLLTWIFEFFISDAFRTDLLRQKATLIISIILILAGIAYSVHTIIPPPTGCFAGSSHFTFSQMTLRESIRSFATVWKAWVPIPILNKQFWDTNIVRYDLIQAILSLILMLAAGILFIKRPVIFFLFTTGLIGIIAFILMYYYGNIRHHGHLFILLISCLWLKAYYQESNFTLRSIFLEKFYGWLTRNVDRLFFILLFIQILAGIYAFTVQIFVPFSAAKMTAQYIRRQKLNRFLIAGDQDVALETVSGYLNKKVFFFSRNAFGTYLIYDEARHLPSVSTVLVMADSLMNANSDTILLVMNYPLKEHPGLNLRNIQSFEKSIRYDEIYYLYLLLPQENKGEPSTPVKK